MYPTLPFRHNRSLGLAVLCLAVCATGEDLSYSPYGEKQQLLHGIDFKSSHASSNAFVGLTTFANLPYVHCLGDASNEELGKFDIAILGAPFDTGVTARPGARFGPGGIRRGSSRIKADFATSVYTGKNVLRSWAKIVDCGDASLTYLDNSVALKQLTNAHRVVSGRQTNASDYPIPRIITLGGDHTTTLPALRSISSRFGPVSVVHFDSHLDTWNPAVLGGDVSHYAGINHGTFLHIAHEEGLILNSSLHVGIRAPIESKKDLKNDKGCGFEVITARAMDFDGVRGIVQKIKDRVKGTKVYITVDIDVLDPAFAPATGTAEVGGWSTRELLSVLDALTGLEVVGADVVEVAPIYDNPGETTVLAASEVALSLLALMVDKPVHAIARARTD